MKTLIAPILFLAMTLDSPAGNIPDLYLQQSESLDGDWNTIIDPYELGYYDYRLQPRDESPTPSLGESFFLDTKPVLPSDRIEYDWDKSPTLKVPGDWNTQKPELLYYEGTLWYRRLFDTPKVQPGERTFLRFGAANYRADVYLNGKKLGTHIGGFTPFTFEITNRMRKEGKNSLVVRVDNKRSKDAVPTVNTDWWNYGGLTRSVKLVTVPATFIAQHQLALVSETTKEITGSVTVDGTAAGEDVTISIPELKIEQTAKTDDAGTASFKFTAPDLVLWQPEKPKLYDVTISCGDNKITEPIGFRTVRAKDKQILVNGKPVFLRGISIHEEFPLDGGGRVKNAAQAEQQLKWAKELGCNFVRLAHYPHNEDITRLADKMGIMVWSEVPVYWTIDWTNEETYKNAEAQLSDNIERDINRASIIIWSLANETPVSDERTKFLGALAAKARSLDPTRLLSAAMERHAKPGETNTQVVQDPLADIVDIVAFNEYIGWYDGLNDKLTTAKWEIPYDKPVFISEFGADAKQGYHGTADQRWTEEYQEDLYKKTLAMIDKIDGIVGFTPWILMDFRSPRRPLPGIQDGFNRKGLLSGDNAEKKKAWFVLHDYYEKKAAEAAKKE